MTAESPLLTRWLARAGDPGARPSTTAAVSPPGPRRSSASERVASALLDGRRSLDGERVALLVSPGAAFVACFFGVLRAGGASSCSRRCTRRRRRGTSATTRACGRVVASSDLARTSRRCLSRPSAACLPRPRGQLARARRRSAPMPRRRRRRAPALHERHDRQAQGGRHHARQPRRRSRRCSARRGAGAPDDVLLHVLPLHHMHGLAIALLSALGAGAATRFLPHVRRARRRGSHGATRRVFMAVPTIHAQPLRRASTPPTPRPARAGPRTRRGAAPGHERQRGAARHGGRALARRSAGAYPLERFGMTEIGVGRPTRSTRRAPPGHRRRSRCPPCRRASSTTSCGSRAQRLRGLPRQGPRRRGRRSCVDARHAVVQDRRHRRSRRRRLPAHPRADQRRHPQERRLQAERPRDRGGAARAPGRRRGRRRGRARRDVGRARRRVRGAARRAARPSAREDALRAFAKERLAPYKVPAPGRAR